MPNKCRRLFFVVFLYCILAHSIYSTTKSSANQPVQSEILHVEAYSYESHTGIVTPAGEIRLSYQQCTEFLAQLLCQSFWTTWLEEDAELTTAMKRIYSGLSEIPFFKTDLTFHFGRDVVKSYSSFGNSGQGFLHSSVTSVSFFIHMLFPSHNLLLLLCHC